MKGKGWRNSALSSPPSGRSLRSPKAPFPRALARAPAAIAGVLSEERTTQPSDGGFREDAEAMDIDGTMAKDPWNLERGRWVFKTKQPPTLNLFP